MTLVDPTMIALGAGALYIATQRDGGPTLVPGQVPVYGPGDTGGRNTVGFDRLHGSQSSSGSSLEDLLKIQNKQPLNQSDYDKASSLAIVDQLKQGAKDEWENLGCEAQKAVIGKINSDFGEQLPNGKLKTDCNASFEAVFTQVSAALAAAGATSGCTALGVPEPAAKVCGTVGYMVGEAMGKKIGPWTKRQTARLGNSIEGVAEKTGRIIDDAQSFLKDIDDAIGAKAKEAFGYVSDKVDDAIDSVGDWIGGWF